MKRLIPVICFMFLCLPSLAWNQEAADVSLDYLNKSVSKQADFFLYLAQFEHSKIEKIKANPDLKRNELKTFGKACKNQNKDLLSLYKRVYFKPAYKKYSEFDKSLSFDEFINSVAISEASKFYQFYGLTEANLRACEALTSR